MLPVALDTTAFHGLPSLGARAPVVLTMGHRSSATLRYRLPADRPRGTWLKIAFRVRITVPAATSQPRGAESLVEAATDGMTSASVALTRNGSRTRWSAPALPEGKDGRTARRTFRVAFTNYVRTQASGTGTHTLRFRLRARNGFRVERAVVEPRTGLLLTHQPPQALKAAVALQSDPYALKVTVTNIGRKPARRIVIQTLADERVFRIGTVPPIARLAAGASTDVLLPLTELGGTGQRHVQVLADSAVGGGLAELDVPPPPPAG